MDEIKLRKKLLRWHYNKLRTIGIVELLQSTYQCFRYRVQHRVNKGQIDFREAIKLANENELWDLQNIIDEERAGI
jgi:hypothetical protein